MIQIQNKTRQLLNKLLQMCCEAIKNLSLTSVLPSKQITEASEVPPVSRGDT